MRGLAHHGLIPFVTALNQKSLYGQDSAPRYLTSPPYDSSDRRCAACTHGHSTLHPLRHSLALAYIAERLARGCPEGGYYDVWRLCICKEPCRALVSPFVRPCCCWWEDKNIHTFLSTVWILTDTGTEIILDSVSSCSWRYLASWELCSMYMHYPSFYSSSFSFSCVL